MVADRDDPHAHPTRVEHHRRARRSFIATRAHGGDPGGAQVVGVSSSASEPKSRAWLLASETQFTPVAPSRSAATGGARK